MIEKTEKYTVLKQGNDYFVILDNPDDDGFLIKRFDSYIQLKLYCDLRGFQEYDN